MNALSRYRHRHVIPRLHHLLMERPVLRYLNVDRLNSIDTEHFRNTKPFPWVNPEGLLHDEKYEILQKCAPGLELFEPQFGRSRSHGQKGHDRYELFYRPTLPVAPEWHQFIAELRGATYRKFLRRLFGFRPLWLSFYWQYAPRGASVSPHCDAKRKLGSHIFYLNTQADWASSWGGQTLILDDHDHFERESAPDFKDFTDCIETNALGNRSLLFARRAKSWHGVRPLSCPETMLRKIFLVVIDDAVLSASRRILAPIKGKRAIAY